MSYARYAKDLLDLLRKERASGDYQGHREWYYKRRDAIINKLDTEGSITTLK